MIHRLMYKGDAYKSRFIAWDDETKTYKDNYLADHRSSDDYVIKVKSAKDIDIKRQQLEERGYTRD